MNNTAGQTVQYRKVGKFELVELVTTSGGFEQWAARQLTGKKSKASAAGVSRIWIAA